MKNRHLIIINRLITFIAMRKIFTLFTLCLMASAAWALEVTFDATVDLGNYSGTAGEFSIVKEGVTVHVKKGMATGAHYRFYKNEPVTISSDANISGVVFTCTASGDAQYGPGCFTATPGDYSYDGNIGTWAGSATSIVFTPATNQVRATKIVVTVGDAGLAAPSITPNAGTYYTPIEVSISCRTSGAKIYYTTNGSNPTTSSTQYTAPFTLSSNATVKAISAKDGEVSDVVSATYEFGTATNVNNIKAYQGMDDDAVLLFNNPVNVLAQNKNYLFVKDNTGYALFYGNCGQTYQNGDVIPAGFIGKKTTYNGEPELTDLSNFKPASGNTPIEPETVTAMAVGHEYFGHLVHLDNVTFSTEDNKNYTLTDDSGNTCAVYFGTMGVSAPNNLQATYNIDAIVGSYGKDNVVYQLLPVKVKSIDPGGVGIGLMANYDDGTELVFDYDATVLFHANSRLFLKDETGFGLAYGNVGQTYKKGDVIPSGYGGKKTTYSGEPELASPFSGFEAPSGHVNVVPEPATPLEVKHEYFAHYVVMSNVTVSEVNGNNFKITDANGNTCNGYNQFGQDVKEGHYDKLEGIVGSYGSTNTVYQLLPIIDAPLGEVGSINELFDLNSGRQAKFTTPLTAIYQNGVNMYVQDVEGTQTLVYGNVPGTFTNGDLINGAVASWTTFQGAKQMIPADNFVPAGRGNVVLPDEPMPIEEVSQDMVHRYMSFENMDIITEDEKTYMVDETGQIQLFNKFNIEYEGSAPYYIEGFLTIYKGELEFYPIKVKGIPSRIPEDVNEDGEVNIGDINVVIDCLLRGITSTVYDCDANLDGEVNIGDISQIIDYMIKH